MLTLSHRGYHVEAPENTLEAFDRAVAMGVDGIETDVRMSADGLPILFHDRLAPDGREVSSHSREALSGLVGYHVPTLDAAVGRHPGVIWNVEIKTPTALETTVAVVSRFSPATRFLVTSFWHPVIDRVSRSVDVDCGLLIAHAPLDLRSPRDWMPRSPRVNTLVWSYETTDDELLRQSTSAGLRNLVYGPVTRADHERLARMTIDGVITDRPEFVPARNAV